MPFTGAGPDTLMLSMGGGEGILPTAAVPEFFAKEFIAWMTRENSVPAYASFWVTYARCRQIPTQI